MKTVVKYCIVLLVIIAILSSCGRNQNIQQVTEENQLVQTTNYSRDQIVLESLNKKFNTNYNTLDQALIEQVNIYESDNNNDNLFNICLVLMEVYPLYEYYDVIIKYSGQLLDTMAQDKTFFNYINNEIAFMNLFMHNYLYSLYESGMNERYLYVVNNLELYIEDSSEVIATVASSIQNLDREQGTLEDYRLLKEALVKYEKEYANSLSLTTQIMLANNLALCSEKLGEFEIAAEYREKTDYLWNEAEKLVN